MMTDINGIPIHQALRTKNIRLVGTQFPPWTEGPGAWGVQHLMHSELIDTLFAECYDKTVELFNQLINSPDPDPDFDLTWHRDSVPAETGKEREHVVRCSHRKVRTPIERHITIHDPKGHDMLGMLKVVLKSGQPNIVHPAAYECRSKRATLHACMGSIEAGGQRSKIPAFKQSLPSSLHEPYANVFAIAEGAGLSQLETAPIL
ncbi:hypothetical protein BD408DRAFT_450228 [Parasitella parasitica]|nr:hypothetical protein BD408DRAFT_450228 [Parasitella parasitica]